MDLSITEMTYNELCESYQDKTKSHCQVQAKEGLVFLDCGGDLVQWVKSIAAHMHTSGVSTSYDPDELFCAAYRLKTSGSQVDLALVFSEQYDFYINVHKLVIWSLRFGENLWISNYVKICRPRHELQFTPDQQTFDAAKKFAELAAIATLRAAQASEKSTKPELESELEPELEPVPVPVTDSELKSG